MKNPFDKTGITFWPVGTGDSTSISVTPETIVQIDIHQLGAATDEEDSRVAVVDRLIETLPKVGDTPYIAVFVLTHPDKDHCLGFTKLIEETLIGEIWFSPRIISDFDEDLCEDAEMFQGEVQRRIDMANSGEELEDGDRIRIIGHHDLLDEEGFTNFPEDLLSVPGHEITTINGSDYSELFRAFIHGPFKDDIEGERNDTSIALQITLKKDGGELKAMLLGDHCYPTVNKIFEISDSSDLNWNVFLAPHHCSKSVMYWKDQGETDVTLKQELLDRIEEASLSPSYIVASSSVFRQEDKDGDNPPHNLARDRYEEISEYFYCTQETPDVDNPSPFRIVVGENGISFESLAEDQTQSEKSIKSAVAEARGKDDPPTTSVGFGSH